MINDIEKGIIREGSRENFLDSSYNWIQENPQARRFRAVTFLVDAFGKVTNPFTTGLVSREPTVSEAQTNWKIGDNATWVKEHILLTVQDHLEK